MIRVLDDLPEGVIGVQAEGKVTADDYETVLIPAVSQATEGDDKARMLMVFGSDFEGYDAEAALDDMKMGAHNWSNFERIAFVTDHSAYRALVKAFGFLMPGQVNVYPLNEIDEAKTWLSS